MTVPPRRPTSTHRMGSALNDPAAPFPRLDPARPNGAPVGDPDIEKVMLDHLARAISQAGIDRMAGDTAPFLAAKVLVAPAGKSLLEWVGVLAKAKVREQAQKAERVEKLAQGIPKGITVDREGPQPDELEGRYDPARLIGKDPQPAEGKMEVIVRVRIGEDRTGGSTWAIDRSRLASFLRTVPRDGSTIHAYMEDMDQEGDIAALCLEAAWTPEDRPSRNPLDAIAEYQANHRPLNMGNPGGLY